MVMSTSLPPFKRDILTEVCSVISVSVISPSLEYFAYLCHTCQFKSWGTLGNVAEVQSTKLFWVLVENKKGYILYVSLMYNCMYLPFFLLRYIFRICVPFC